jgi:mRNA interferase HigB
MRVIGTDKLFDFSGKHPPARAWIRAWIAEVRSAEWITSRDIRARYPSASILMGNLVIFNVKGNDYRMVTHVAYKTRVVLIKWIGTHSAYSKIDWESSQNETRSN